MAQDSSNNPAQSAERDAALKAVLDRLGTLFGVQDFAELPPGAAVIVIFGRLGGAPASALTNPSLAAIGHDLEAHGVFARFMPQIFSSLPAAAHAIGMRPDLSSAMIGGALSLLRFPAAASAAWSDDIFRLFVIPLMTAMTAAGRLPETLMLEETIYKTYVKARENAAHFRTVYAQLSPVLAAGGRAVGRALPPLPPLERQSRYRVAFVAVNLTYLAHISTAIDIIECIKGLPASRLDCALIGLIGADTRTVNRCARLGIEVQTIVTDLRTAGTSVEVFAKLRRVLSEQGFHGVVWLTVPPGCAFAMGMRLAPAQIYFTMKYHSLSIPEFDDYLSGGPAGQKFNIIDGRRYRIGQTRFAELVEPSLAPSAAQIRDEIGPQWTVLGCLGREEKINSPAFLSAVCAILIRNPQTVFLWTGRAKLPSIQQAFEKAGVANRCIFIGWVDTRLYAHVLDIFLDSFPFPCGLTALQTMAAGKPVVFFDSPEARETGVPVFVQPVLEGEAGDEAQRARYRELLQPDAAPPLFPLAPDAVRYGELADLLITNPGYRSRVGQALKSFVEAYITDRDACGRTYEAHIFEAIDAVAGGDKPPAAT